MTTSTLVLAVLLLQVLSSSAHPEEPHDEAVPQNLPVISSTAQTIVPLAALDTFLRNSPLALVAFYSPECGACIGYIPEFDRASEMYRNETTASDAIGDEERVAFARVDISGTGPLVEHAVKRFTVSKFPSVRIVVNGDQVSPVAVEDMAKSAEQISFAAHQIGRRFHYEGAALHSLGDVRTLIETRLIKDAEAASAGRTLVIAKFDPTDRPGGDNKDGRLSSCRNAFSAAMVALIEVPFLEVHVTFDDKAIDYVMSAATDGHDIGLPGWLAHPDEIAECSGHSSIAIVKCASIFAGECRIAAAQLPMPSSAAEVVKLLAAHALPPVVEYDPSVKVLIEKAWMDTSIPLVAPTIEIGSGVSPRKRGARDVVAAAGYDQLRSARRTRPVLIYFTQVKNCGENTSEARSLRYLRRTLRNVAYEHPNISFVIADCYEYNTLYLRFGFRRHHARANTVFGIMDGGRRYSALQMNFTAGYSADKVRAFVARFNNGTLERHLKTSSESNFDDVVDANDEVHTPAESTDGGFRAEGLRVVGSQDLERALFRLDSRPTAVDRRAVVGGRDDAAIVLFAHKHCYNCRALIRRFRNMAAAQRDIVGLLDDVADGPSANDEDIPAMFLSTPDPTRTFEPTPDDAGRESGGQVADTHAGVDGVGPNDFDLSLELLEEAQSAEKFYDLTVGETKRTGRLSPLARILRRLTIFAVNASDNDTPSEQWMPDPQLNVFPVVAVAFRTSRIAYGHGGDAEGAWDVTVRAPVLMDLHTRRYGDSGPRELRLLEFAAAELRAGKRLGQRFVRG